MCKEKSKVLDAVLFLILPFVMCISAFVLAPGIVDSNGAYHVSIISSVSLMYFVKDLVAIVALSKSNVSMHSVMEEIEKLSDYTFFYNDNQIKLDKKISVNAKNASIEQVLNQMFKDSGYTYKIVNNQILISTVKAVNVIEHQQQKSRTITGCVKDVNGEPIIGASVVEKGVATNGTVTDFEGNYTLTISSDELQISYIGYLPQVVKVHSGTSFYNVTLKEDTKTLDEVVVIGYGTQKKVNLTGSVASVSSSEIKDRVQTNVLSAVQGTVPGVTVISRPGSTPSINFRGRGNL